MEKEKHYYHVVVTDELCERNECFLIIGYEEPSFDEIEVFCKEILSSFGCDRVAEIVEISRECADKLYNLQNEDKFIMFK